MGIPVSIPSVIGNAVLIVVTVITIAQTLPYYSAEGEEENLPPEPAHCYEWVDGGWQDICV